MELLFFSKNEYTSIIVRTNIAKSRTTDIIH